MRNYTTCIILINLFLVSNLLPARNKDLVEAYVQYSIVIDSLPCANTLFINVKDYGARGDGVTLNTRSIQAAIEACSKAGGGTVYFPSGKYLSGTIYLKSFVSLLLEAGAILTGSKNITDYPATVSKIRSYTDNYTEKSLVYGEGLEHIAIIGQGTIDGNGASFEYNGSYKNRPYMIRIINCRKVLIRDVNLINSPMWVQHYLACEDVTIDAVSVSSRVNKNNDGIDIDGCENVRISNCLVFSEDDGIVLKSTLDKVCKNVTITNCVISSMENAFKMGTETNGGFQNIVFSNSTIYDTRRCGISLQLVDGGTLNDVSVSNITMNNVDGAISIRLGNRARPYIANMLKPDVGKLKNVIISNIQATNIGKIGCSVVGLTGHPVENILLENIRITFKGGGTPDLVSREIPEIAEAYPQYEMFGMLPAYGFYCRHAENVWFNHIELYFDEPEARPAIVCDDINSLEFHSIKAMTTGMAPLFWFKNVSNAFVHSCMAPVGTETFLQVSGSGNKHITLIGNDLSDAKNAVKLENNSVVFMDNNRMK